MTQWQPPVSFDTDLQPAPDDQPAKPPVWPKVIGIVSICLGSLNVIGNCFNVGWTLAFPPIMRALAAKSGAAMQMADPFAMLPPWYRSVQVPLSLVGLAVGVILLIAGIKLVRKKPSARALHVTYIVLQTILAIVGVVFGAAMMSHTKQAMEQSASSGAQVPPEVQEFLRIFERGTSTVVLIAGLLFGLAYPVFLTIWFLRDKVRREIASWRAAPAGVEELYGR